MGARALVNALVTPASPATRNILTVHTHSGTMSTGIDVDETGRVQPEHPGAVRSLGAIMGAGRPVGLVLRSFTDEIAYTLPNGVNIPVKTVRSWILVDGVPQPQAEQDTCSASCTDAETGEPLPPERGG